MGWVDVARRVDLQMTQMGADKEGILQMDAGVVGGLRDGIRGVAGKAWMPAFAGVTGET